MYRFEKIKEWNISIENYFYRNIISQFLTYACTLFLYLRNYCAYSKYYIVKKAKKLNIIYCVIQKKNMYKIETKWFLVFLVWFKISAVPYAAQSYCPSIWIAVIFIIMADGFQKFFHLHPKRNLEIAKKISYHPMMAFWLKCPLGWSAPPSYTKKNTSNCTSTRVVCCGDWNIDPLLVSRW